MVETTTLMVIDEIKTLLEEVIGFENMLALNVNSDTQLSKDISLDSLEYVELFELLINKYPEVNFTDWLSENPTEKIMNLTLNDIAKFITDENYK